MAWTWYEGKLEATGRFKEAEKDFNKPVGEHTPFGWLCDALVALEKGEAKTSKIGDELWILTNWGCVRFTKEGVIEIAEPAA